MGAPFVSEEVADRETVLPTSRRFSLLAVLEQVVPCLCLVLTSPALRVRVFRPLHVLPGMAVPRSGLMELLCQPLRSSCHRSFWHIFPGSLYFFFLTLFSDQLRASSHFFSSAISRLMLASYGPGERHSSPPISIRVSGSSAASFASSFAFSFPATPSWAGHHRIVTARKHGECECSSQCRATCDYHHRST